MPVVKTESGTKHFPYTKSGKSAAKKAMLKKMVQSKGKKGDSATPGGKYSFLKKFAKK